MPTIGEYQALLREAEEKRAKVAELEETFRQLQEELARLKGEAPPVAALPEKPWYAKWTTWLLAGGLGTLIGGIAYYKKKKK